MPPHQYSLAVLVEAVIFIDFRQTVRKVVALCGLNSQSNQQFNALTTEFIYLASSSEFAKPINQ